MTYLTQNQAKSSGTWWLRSGATGCIKLGTFHFDAPGRYITTEGEQETQAEEVMCRRDEKDFF